MQQVFVPALRLIDSWPAETTQLVKGGRQAWFDSWVFDSWVYLNSLLNGHPPPPTTLLPPAGPPPLSTEPLPSLLVPASLVAPWLAHFFVPVLLPLSIN